MDPRSGRFLSYDPLSNEGGGAPASYDYAGGDPVDQVDPTGLQETLAGFLVANQIDINLRVRQSAIAIPIAAAAACALVASADVLFSIANVSAIATDGNLTPSAASSGQICRALHLMRLQFQHENSRFGGSSGEYTYAGDSVKRELVGTPPHGVTALQVRSRMLQLLAELQAGTVGKFFPKTREKELVKAIVDVSKQLNRYLGVGTPPTFHTAARSEIGEYRLELENIVGKNLVRSN
jgi:uncharacterized protein RhaS with RHS repeats